MDDVRKGKPIKRICRRKLRDFGELDIKDKLLNKSFALQGVIHYSQCF
ncbi:hypothetical protein C7M18_03513 [Bacillus velezensis]|nr:hypothetical protein O205_18250 [Bacillus amyloliquefaciens EGD-AQ14]QHK04615.1 hypothetical protein C7M18_03513 [Bacillus velezensis]